MQKVRLAVCIRDQEYANRFTNCLLGHYGSRFELHLFTGAVQLLEAQPESYDVLLCSDRAEELEKILGKWQIPVVCLLEEEQERELYAHMEDAEGRLCFVDKYQEVNRIVDEILKRIGDEIRNVQQTGSISPRCRLAGVYSLSENEYQLPFTVTLGSILGEQERALILDLQENSGFSQLAGRGGNMGLEELLVMAETEKFARGRLMSCIGHLDRVDYIYPVENTECLCEAALETYLKVLQMLTQELDYGVIIINFGARFVGFFEVLNRCQEIYLMQKRGGLCQWRESEFMEELEAKGYQELMQRMTKVELPIMTEPAVSCERLVEQWKWNEFGDCIRKMTPGAAGIG